VTTDLRTLSYQGIRVPASYSTNAVGDFVQITGAGFIDVANVLINGYRSPEFIVDTSQRIFAAVPTAVAGQIITDIQVLLLSPLAGTENAVILDIGGGNGRIEGSAKLVQTFVKMLLTTPGSNIFSPQLGGGLLQLSGDNMATPTGSIESEARAAISRTEAQIKALHTSTPRLSDSEKLRSVNITSVNVDVDTSTLSIRLELTAQDGSRVSAGVIT
jgi:phage baseplate assembly protein W